MGTYKSGYRTLGEKARCTENHPTTNWPYTARCILDAPHDNDWHEDKYGVQWGPVPISKLIGGIPLEHADVVKQVLRNLVGSGYRILDQTMTDVSQAIIDEAEGKL